MPECPDCGDEFDSQGGLDVHRSRWCEEKSNRPFMGDIQDMPISVLQVPEIRLRILSKAGRSGSPMAPLGKGDLNAIHAFLTGEWHFPKKVYGTFRSPPIEDVRNQVAVQAGIEEWLTDDEGEPIEEVPERPFKRSELIELYKAMVDSGDNRPRPGEQAKETAEA